MEANAITARECLMGTMVQQISGRGYYSADLDPTPAQALVDLRWAAQMAGRLIGRRMETCTSAVGEHVPMKITVVVTPAKPARSGFDVRIQSIVERLLQLGTDHPARESA